MDEVTNNKAPKTNTVQAGEPDAGIATDERTSNNMRTIQPSASLVQELAKQKQNENIQPETSVTASQTTEFPGYQEASNATNHSNLSPSQQFALTSVEMQFRENDRPVCLRVKPLLAVGILGILGGLFAILVAFLYASSGLFSLVAATIGLIQIGMSVYLLIGRDHNTTALILKIYLVFQLLNLIFNFFDVLLLTINALVILFLFYVYSRVKLLKY